MHDVSSVMEVAMGKAPNSSMIACRFLQPWCQDRRKLNSRVRAYAWLRADAPRQLGSWDVLDPTGKLQRGPLKSMGPEAESCIRIQDPLDLLIVVRGEILKPRRDTAQNTRVSFIARHSKSRQPFWCYTFAANLGKTFTEPLGSCKQILSGLSCHHRYQLTYVSDSLYARLRSSKQIRRVLRCLERGLAFTRCPPAVS